MENPVSGNQKVGSLTRIPMQRRSCLEMGIISGSVRDTCSGEGEKCNAPIPNTEDNAKVSEVGALLPGRTENFQDRSLQ